MPKNLVIVESPTKAKTLSKFLGSSYQIEASMGHVRDLPKAKLGVDVDHDFEPTYVIPRSKRKIVERLRTITAAAEEVILATDPDREGEAIAWHIQQLAAGSQKSKVKSQNNFKRIVFHEITKEAILEALRSPREVDLKRVDAQVARRVLDRLVGYKLSPLLWKKVKGGLSAGRVQSVAVRLIVEREREIEKFEPNEYWLISALVKSKKGKEAPTFEAKLVKKDDKKVEVGKENEAKKIVKELEAKDTNWQVAKVEEKQIKKSPPPPFTTSTLTQTASNSFGFTAKKTMKVAQDLYEHGLITYHRTDSVNLAPTALAMARGFIQKQFGAEYLPVFPRVFKTKSKLAQEAHEAVRPTKIGTSADQIKMSPDHKKLYNLVWRRFTASQTAEAVYDQVTLEVTAISDQRSANSYLFKASGSVIKFPGYLKVYGREAGESTSPDESRVPVLPAGEKLDLLKLLPTQHFTEPPPRYTEASLIKELEEKGIGRPSTYAPIISTIQDRNYVELEQRKFRPTPIGAATSDFLVKNFAGIVDYSFTAKMEEALDDIASGEKKWKPVISDFYDPFAKNLEKVFAESDRVKIFLELTNEQCPDGHPLVIRYGRFGKFLACEKFPEHKFTKNFEEKTDSKCPESGDPVIIKRTRRGRPFYGCSAYPACKWMSWQLPKEARVDTEKPQN